MPSWFQVDIVQDFNEDEIKKLSNELCGQEIDEIRIDDKRMDSYLEISLSDGRVLRFRYDCIDSAEKNSPARNYGLSWQIKKDKTIEWQWFYPERECQVSRDANL